MAAQDFPFLEGKTVEQIWTWSDTVRLVFDLGDRADPGSYVDVHAESWLRHEGADASLDVLNRPLEAGRVLTLLNQRVTRAQAEQGVLEVAFANGAELRSPPDDRYESWTVVGDAQVFQCMPGGEIESW